MNVIRRSLRVRLVSFFGVFRHGLAYSRIVYIVGDVTSPIESVQRFSTRSSTLKPLYKINHREKERDVHTGAEKVGTKGTGQKCLSAMYERRSLCETACDPRVFNTSWSLAIAVLVSTSHVLMVFSTPSGPRPSCEQQTQLDSDAKNRRCGNSIRDRTPGYGLRAIATTGAYH